MNALDLLLLGLLLLAFLGGLRAGFVARALSWAGLVVGIVVSTRTVPFALGLVPDGGPPLRLFVAVFVLALTIAACSALVQAIGSRLRAKVDASRLSGVDRGLGAIAGMALVLAFAWFVLPAVADVPGAVAREVRGSTVLGALRSVTPPPPDATRTVGALLDSSRFPEVFADLQPAPVTGPPPEQIPIDAGIVERVTASTVNVEARGCGRRFEGSGVAVDEDLILTNAHVVAGATEVVVRRPDGSTRPAQVVRFEPDDDLAVLAVDGLGQQPLELALSDTPGPAVAIGYPGGQDTPRVAPVRIEQRRSAEGRDIYGEGSTQREVLFLASTLQQGDSGAPVIDADGRVVGLVFAISPDVATTAYALDHPELQEAVAAPRDPGSAGRCIG